MTTTIREHVAKACLAIATLREREAKHLSPGEERALLDDAATAIDIVWHAHVGLHGSLQHLFRVQRSASGWIDQSAWIEALDRGERIFQAIQTPAPVAQPPAPAPRAPIVTFNTRRRAEPAFGERNDEGSQ